MQIPARSSDSKSFRVQCDATARRRREGWSDEFLINYSLETRRARSQIVGREGTESNRPLIGYKDASSSAAPYRLGGVGTGSTGETKNIRNARDKGEEYVSAINSSSPFPKPGLDGSHSYVRMINCSTAARERNRSGDLDDLDNRTQGNRCVV